MRELHRVKSKISLQLEPRQIWGGALLAVALLAGAFVIGRASSGSAEAEAPSAGEPLAGASDAGVSELDSKVAVACPICVCPVCSESAASAAGSPASPFASGSAAAHLKLTQLAPQAFELKPLSPEDWRLRASSEPQKLQPKTSWPQVRPPTLGDEPFPKAGWIGATPEPNKYENGQDFLPKTFDNPSIPPETHLPEPSVPGFLSGASKTQPSGEGYLNPPSKTQPSGEGHLNLPGKTEASGTAGAERANQTQVSGSFGAAGAEASQVSGSAGATVRVPDMHGGTTARPSVEGRYAHLGERSLPRRLEAGSLEGRYSVQMGEFRELREAETLQGKLRQQGFEARIDAGFEGETRRYSVRMGHFDREDEARAFQSRYGAQTGEQDLGRIVQSGR